MIVSPCISICKTDPKTGYCYGCGRNNEEKQIWKKEDTSDDWKKINEEPQVQSVTENTQGLPEHLANAFNKDYSQVMQKVEEKARFKNGA